MNPDSDPAEKSAEEVSEQVPEAAGGRWQRLKQFFVSRYLRVIDTLSGVLKRLRSLVGKPKEEGGEGEERGEARSSRKKSKAPAADEAALAAAPPAAHSPVRSLLIYLLVLVVGIIAGMIFSFALLSNMVINQAHKIGDQRDEISQLEKQYSRVLETEAKYRNRLTETETLLNQLSRKLEKEAEPADPATAPAATTEKPAAAKKTANCALEAGNPDKFARCLEEFNRKTGR
ncbi:MAG: hypothetical protein D4S02_05275 [Rhodocyclaceae bacterium]|nr:MAG: hypothetical protein D4S02_05275 [Rhodocyclaceae bacterium]